MIDSCPLCRFLLVGLIIHNENFNTKDFKVFSLIPTARFPTFVSPHRRRKRCRSSSSSFSYKPVDHDEGHDDEDESYKLQQALARQKPTYTSTYSSKDTWFQHHDSLPFECTSCGKCCKVKGDVYLSPTETLAVAKYLNLSLQEFKRRFISKEEMSSGWTLLRNIQRQNSHYEEEDNRCIFLDDSNMCAIYPVRPIQCITYPFWPRIMASPQAWNDEVVEAVINPDLDVVEDEELDTPSTNTITSVSLKRWTYEDGGCEGMKRIDSKEARTIQGITIQDAQSMLDVYTRYDRSFPIGKPFQSIISNES